MHAVERGDGPFVLTDRSERGWDPAIVGAAPWGGVVYQVVDGLDGFRGERKVFCYYGNRVAFFLQGDGAGEACYAGAGGIVSH